MADPVDTIWMTELFKASPVGMVLFDREGSIVWANDKMQALTNLSFNQLIGLDRDKANSFQLTDLFTKPETLEIKYRTNQMHRYLGCEYKTLKSPTGSAVEACFYTDITEVRMLQQRVERLILTDEMTGALNQRGLTRDLEPLISRCRRYENALSLIQFEFDCSASEDVERTMLQLCRGIRSELRWADLICRYTKNNFLLVLPETGLEAAQKLADKLIEHLQSFFGTEMPACCGTAAEWERGNDVKMLLERMENGMTAARDHINECVVAA